VFKPSAVSSEAGKLKMTIAPDGTGGYTAGEDSTQKFGFGHYEASMQAVATPGVVTSFNAYGDPKTAVNMEVVGNNPRQIQVTTQTATGDKSQIVDLPFDTSQGMHNYAFDWAPDHVDFYADGKKIASLNDPAAIPQQPMGILANTWVSNDPKWTGAFPNPSQPLNSYYGGISYSPN